MSMRRRAGLGLFVITCFCAYLATGITTVAPGEVAVVRRLGKFRREPWPPGLHLAAPWGIDRVTLVPTEQVRRLNVGLAGIPGATDDPAAGEFLTGDLNLLRARATVQYRVTDPVAFTMAAESVEPLLIRLAEASLARVLARQGIDATLRAGRAEASRLTEDEIPARCRALSTGRRLARRQPHGRAAAQRSRAPISRPLNPRSAA